jgi:hypothetical protein
MEAKIGARISRIATPGPDTATNTVDAPDAVSPIAARAAIPRQAKDFSCSAFTG